MRKEMDWESLASSLPLQRQDGEISMSVDDTNALRKRLGLSALNAAESSSTVEAKAVAERNYELARAARKEARRLADIEAELAKAKRKRELREMNQGGEGLIEVEEVSAEEWVSRQKKLQAEKMAKLFEERDDEGVQEVPKVTAASAAGIKLGEERILTLRDASILEKNEHGQITGLRDEDDAMEHVQLAEEARRKKVLNDARHDAMTLRAGGYDASDDREFLNVDDAYSTSTKPLPGEGAVAASMRLSAWGSRPVVTGEAKFQSDYMSADEARAFFKKAKAKHQKKRQIMPSSTTGEEDRMTRDAALKRKRLRDAREDDAIQKRKLDSVKAAKDKQQALVDVGLGKRQPMIEEDEEDEVRVPPAPVVEEPKQKFIPGLEDDNDDAELRAALARARTTNLQKPKAPLEPVVVAIKDEEEEKPSSSGLVFTSTTEFTTRLHARLEERAADAVARSAAETLATADDETDDVEDEEEIDFLHKQPLASGGLASAMDLFKATGDLQPVKPKEMQVGRARDQRIFDDDDDNEIKLEYRDADGRLLTRREAFRQLCHRFHGKAPGKKKIEKFQAKLRDDQRSMKHNTGIGSLSILKHVQEKTGAAFIPIHNQSTITSLAAAAQQSSSSSSRNKNYNKKSSSSHKSSSSKTS